MVVESVLERTMPQSIEAEMSVLGAMILDNEVINLVIPILNKLSFYKTAHRELYQAIVDVYDKGQPVDLVVLREGIEKAFAAGKSWRCGILDGIGRGRPNNRKCRILCEHST